MHIKEEKATGSTWVSRKTVHMETLLLLRCRFKLIDVFFLMIILFTLQSKRTVQQFMNYFYLKKNNNLLFYSWGFCRAVSRKEAIIVDKRVYKKPPCVVFNFASCTE